MIRFATITSSSEPAGDLQVTAKIGTVQQVPIQKLSHSSYAEDVAAADLVLDTLSESLRRLAGR